MYRIKMYIELLLTVVVLIVLDIYNTIYYICERLLKQGRGVQK